MKLKQSMERKAWVVKTTPNRLERPVGIEGLRRRRELEQRRTGKVATDAFTDLKALMDQAQEVVSIMERYQAQLKSVDVNQTNQTRKNRGDAEARKINFSELGASGVESVPSHMSSTSQRTNKL